MLGKMKDVGQEQWAAVDRHLSDLFELEDSALERAIENARRAGLPDIGVTPPQGMLLHLLAKACLARSILEIGTLGGYSTIWLARALPPGGRLVTLESDPAHVGVARTNIANAGLADLVEVRLGQASDTLPTLTGPFDFIFIDADKPSYPAYLDWSLKLAQRGTVIVADNVVREGEIVNDRSDDPRVQGVREFLVQLAREPRVSASVMQTVGAKGYDGFAIAVVTPEAGG
jgi:predicted O-methyltransferase YrrM